MKKRINKKKRIVYLLLIVLLTITVGYAVVMTNLKLIGYTTVSKKAWGVYFDNVQLKEGSSPNEEPEIDKESDDDPEKSLVTFNAALNELDDFYEFTVDVVNEGQVDVMITNYIKTTTPTLPNAIKFEVTYEDGVPIAENHIIKKAVDSENPTRETYKVSVRYDLDNITTVEEINELSTDVTYEFEFGVTYGRATTSGVERDKHIATCPGCVFTYYTTYTRFAPNHDNTETQIATVENYQTNYTKLKYSVNQYDSFCTEPEEGEENTEVCHDIDAIAFIGHTLGENNVIDKTYLCGIFHGKPYCLQVDKSTRKLGNKVLEKNREIINEIFDFNSDCYEENYDNSSYDYYLYCSTQFSDGSIGEITISDSYYGVRETEISNRKPDEYYDYKCKTEDGAVYCYRY